MMLFDSKDVFWSWRACSQRVAVSYVNSYIVFILVAVLILINTYILVAVSYYNLYYNHDVFWWSWRACSQRVAPVMPGRGDDEVRLRATIVIIIIMIIVTIIIIILITLIIVIKNNNTATTTTTNNNNT